MSRLCKHCGHERTSHMNVVNGKYQCCNEYACPCTKYEEVWAVDKGRQRDVNEMMKKSSPSMRWC